MKIAWNLNENRFFIIRNIPNNFVGEIPYFGRKTYFSIQ